LPLCLSRFFPFLSLWVCPHPAVGSFLVLLRVRPPPYAPSTVCVGCRLTPRHVTVRAGPMPHRETRRSMVPVLRRKHLIRDNLFLMFVRGETPPIFFAFPPRSFSPFWPRGSLLVFRVRSLLFFPYSLLTGNFPPFISPCFVLFFLSFSRFPGSVLPSRSTKSCPVLPLTKQVECPPPPPPIPPCGFDWGLGGLLLPYGPS